MTRTTVNILLIATFTSFIFILFSCSRKGHAGGTASNSKKKPNIIFILADDLGYGDLSSYGQQHFQTPNIDRLAGEGMKFTQHYSGSTVCAPSRSVLLTGLHTGHTPIRGNKEIQPEGQAPLLDSVITVAELLKEAGYVTGAFGKWGLGYPGSEGEPTKQGFDEFYGYNCQRYSHRYYPPHLWHNGEKVELENDSTNTIEYAQDGIHKRALQFMENYRDQSFFLYLPYLMPHAELIVPEDSIFDRFKGKFPEEPWHGNDYGENFKPAGYTSQQFPHATFAAMVTRLDLYVGDIVAKLRELGIDEETMIVFASDNGPHVEGGGDPQFFNSSGSLRGTKRDLYDGGIRVPFIVCWKGKVAANTVSDHVSAFWDFLPTACEIAGIEKPNGIDGISYLAELQGKEQKQHDHLYWEFYEDKGKQAVRKGKWKGVRQNVHEQPDAPVELYDLSRDTSEQNNIASLHPEIIAEITGIMKAEHCYSPEFNFEFERGSGE